MAEELYMSIKTDVKSATKETQDYTKSLQGAQGKVKEVNEQLAIQNKYILEQEKELLRLKQAQDAGVEVLCYKAELSSTQIQLKQAVEFINSQTKMMK